jgi:general secretion pathway protein C
MTPRLPSLVNFLLAIALAATGTYWVLQLTARRSPPEPVVAMPAGDRVARSQPQDTTSIAGLFGSASAGGSPGRVRLAGVIAEGARGSGVALLSVDGQPPIAYRAGDAIDAQMTLAEVHADRVVIRTEGGARDIRLPDGPASGGIEPAR